MQGSDRRELQTLESYLEGGAPSPPVPTERNPPEVERDLRARLACAERPLHLLKEVDVSHQKQNNPAHEFLSICNLADAMRGAT